MTVTTTTTGQCLTASLLAAGAATAERPAGPCALCGRAILRGQRYATLAQSGRLAHLPCIASGTRQAPRQPAAAIR